MISTRISHSARVLVQLVIMRSEIPLQRGGIRNLAPEDAGKTVRRSGEVDGARYDTPAPGPAARNGLRRLAAIRRQHAHGGAAPGRSEAECLNPIAFRRGARNHRPPGPRGHQHVVVVHPLVDSLRVLSTPGILGPDDPLRVATLRQSAWMRNVRRPSRIRARSRPSSPTCLLRSASSKAREPPACWRSRRRGCWPSCSVGDPLAFAGTPPASCLVRLRGDRIARWSRCASARLADPSHTIEQRVTAAAAGGLLFRHAAERAASASAASGSVPQEVRDAAAAADARLRHMLRGGWHIEVEPAQPPTHDSGRRAHSAEPGDAHCALLVRQRSCARQSSRLATAADSAPWRCDGGGTPARGRTLRCRRWR